MSTFTANFNGKVYKYHHGDAFDRGMADSYYGRSYCPHFFLGDTYTSKKIFKEQMTETEIANYRAGWDFNSENGDFKY